MGPDQNLTLNTAAQFQNVDEIGKLIVARHGTTAIQLNQVATVAVGTQPPVTFVRVNGQSALIIQVQKQSGSNVVQTAALVRDELNSLSHDFPNLDFNIVQRRLDFYSTVGP